MASTPPENEIEFGEEKRVSYLDVVRDNVKKQGQVLKLLIIILVNNALQNYNMRRTIKRW